jgi:hypothetical protein
MNNRFSKGTRVVVRAATLLVGTIKTVEARYGKPRYLVDTKPRGGPIYCEEWELELATALDDLASAVVL